MKAKWSPKSEIIFRTTLCKIREMRFTKDDPDRHVLIMVVLGKDFHKNSILAVRKSCENFKIGTRNLFCSAMILIFCVFAFKVIWKILSNNSSPSSILFSVVSNWEYKPSRKFRMEQLRWYERTRTFLRLVCKLIVLILKCYRSLEVVAINY